MTLKTISRPREQFATVSRETEVTEVTRLMQEQSAEAVVVVDDEEPIGLVTDRDVALDVVSRERDFETPVEEVMTRDVVTLSVDADTETACAAMKRNKVRHLTLVEDDRAVGLVTADELFMTLEEQLCDIADVVRYETPLH